jgi:hypothetical protein
MCLLTIVFLIRNKQSSPRKNHFSAPGIHFSASPEQSSTRRIHSSARMERFSITRVYSSALRKQSSAPKIHFSATMEQSSTTKILSSKLTEQLSAPEIHFLNPGFSISRQPVFTNCKSNHAFYKLNHAFHSLASKKWCKYPIFD